MATHLLNFQFILFVILSTVLLNEGKNIEQGNDWDTENKVLYGEPITLFGDEELLEFVKEKEKKQISGQLSLESKDKKKSDTKNHEKKTIQNHNNKQISPDLTTKKDKTIKQKKSPLVSQVIQTCSPVTLPLCKDLDLYTLAQFPNFFGHISNEEVSKSLKPYKSLWKDTKCGNMLKKFVCLLYVPQCSGTDVPLLPCKDVCRSATAACDNQLHKTGLSWPEEWSCDMFSASGLCADPYTKVTPVPEPKSEQETKKTAPSDTMKLEDDPNTKTQSKEKPIRKSVIKPRKYNIRQTGQPELFQGWADVQGQGAANDYCRVIGNNPSLRFLSCTVAGNTQPDHHYVSKRGFDLGHKHTWFMRDMDGDGRDDYCRCVGRGLQSLISCMKAGEFGFYGSPQQPGNEYTFTVKTQGPCFQKKFNPFIGNEV